MRRVLVIEDDAKVRASLKKGLEGAGFEVESAATGERGSGLATAQPYDCIILDWMLPGRDGIQILADLRQSGQSTPVLMLTARDAIEDRVLGLESGAEDYLLKPFAFAELLARLRVMLRRNRGEREMVLRAGNLEIDLACRRAAVAGAEVKLKQKELDVLEYLVRHKNESVTREMLGMDVWKEPDYAYTNVIEVYINLLRKKLEAASANIRITTVRGVGYVLQE